MVLAGVWYFLWVLLWAVFFLTDGVDLGIASLMPFLARDERDKRIMYGVMGPLWDGNEVWLIAAGGVTFAAFPMVYATMFSTLYAPLMIILFCLIARGVSFEFRGKIQNERWRRVWDGALFVGSVVPAILFGTAFANIFRGIPFDADGVYRGTLLSLLNPYGLIGGVLFLLIFLVHGAIWLAVKSTGSLHDRAVRAVRGLWVVLLAVAIIDLAATWFETSVFDRYLDYPALFLVIVLAVAALIGIRMFLAQGKLRRAWISSSVMILAATFFGFVGLFPVMFPSSLSSEYSITAFGAASSRLTLTIMLVVTVILVPIVIAYQAWAYRLFKGKITEDDLEYGER